MNTSSREALPAKPGEDSPRAAPPRKFGWCRRLGAAGASLFLLCAPAGACASHVSGPAMVSVQTGRDIPLFLGTNAPSQDALANMRNDVATLKGVLGGLMGMEGSVVYRPARSADFSGARSVARTCLELADDFMRESENPAPERMDYLNGRWEFVHTQMVYSIRFYRDGLRGMGIGTRILGQEFGVDLEGI